jgi:hypothetical protein
MLKTTFFTALLLAFSFTVSAQEVELKDDKILLDGKEILKYEKIDLMKHSFFTLDSGDEILYFLISDNETLENLDDDYFTLKFLTEKINVESNEVSKIASISSKKTIQKLIKWLVKEKVIGVDGKLDRAKLEIFHEKFHAKITEKAEALRKEAARKN